MKTPDVAWVRRHVVGLRRLTQIAACLLWTAFALVAIPSATYKLHFGAGTVVSLLVLAILVTLLRLSVSEFALAVVAAKDPSYAQPRLERVEPPDPSRLADYYSFRFIESGFDGALPQVINSLIYPSSQVSRLSQRFELQGKRWNVTLGRTISLSPDARLFPVHRVPKGSIVGSMKAHVDDQRVTTLQYAESKGLVLFALDILWAKVFEPLRHSKAVEQLDLFKQASETLKSVSAGIVSSDALQVARYQSLVEEVDDLLKQTSALDLDKSVIRVVVRLALAYDVIFVLLPEKPAGNTGIMRVRVEYDLFADHSLHGGVSRFRALFGIGERHYQFAIPYVSDTESFHLDVVGPSGMYVYHAVPVWPLFARVQAKELKSTPGRIRNQGVMTSPYSGDERIHLYLRDFDGRPIFEDGGAPKPDKETSLIPRFDVEFREVPPGLNAAVLAVSLWLVVLTWAVGMFHNVIFGLQPSGPIGSWPTLIFGVPAIVTGWLFSRATQAAVRVISIPTFLVLMWLAINSAALVTVVAFKSAGIESQPFDFYLPFLGKQQMSHPTWTTLMISSFLNFASSLSMFITKNSRYAAIVNGRD